VDCPLDVNRLSVHSLDALRQASQLGDLFGRQHRPGASSSRRINGVGGLLMRTRVSLAAGALLGRPVHWDQITKVQIVNW